MRDRWYWHRLAFWLGATLFGLAFWGWWTWLLLSV